MNKQTKTSDVEEAAFPAEFINSLTETAIKTLMDYLEKTGAPSDAVLLLDSATVLMKETPALENGGKVGHMTNQTLIENVSDASRCIAALGGVFYAPSGTTAPRESAS